MSETLGQRLRGVPWCGVDHCDDLQDQAADRIEELEAAIRKHRDGSHSNVFVRDVELWAVLDE